MSPARERPRAGRGRARRAPSARFDHLLLLVDGQRARREALRAHLATLPARGAARGAGPRFLLEVAASRAEATRRAGSQPGAVAVDLGLPRRGALALVAAVRAADPDGAILAFTSRAVGPEASAAILAGADFFHTTGEPADPAAFERALELAIDRRRLTRLIERSELEAQAARDRLAQLYAEMSRSVPGLRPPMVREDVLPFRTAARQYLVEATRLFEGDSRGLARQLGLSYFALRRLLARYDVPLPSRSQKHGTARPVAGSR